MNLRILTHAERDLRGTFPSLWPEFMHHDEAVFPDPFTFRVDRAPNEHYGFGIGVHFCLGANLARLELQEIFKRLVERLDEVEPTGPVERMHSSFVGGIKRMPVRWWLRT